MYYDRLKCRLLLCILLNVRYCADSIPSALTILFSSLWLVTFIASDDCGCFCGCAKPRILLLIAAVDHILDLSRFRVQIDHRCAQALVPHDLLDQARVSRFRHGHCSERVPGTIELQNIRDTELSGDFPEHVLDSAQLDMS
jgi:hypothetical protein